MEDGRELELVEGTVASLIFQNEENGYTILRLERGGEELTLVGEMPGVSPGEYLSVQGRWVRHATYGAQFKAEIVERRLPQSLKEVFHYLASGAVKGVGKSTARRLVEAVYVLSYHRPHLSPAFQIGKGSVGCVWLCAQKQHFISVKSVKLLCFLHKEAVA